MPLKIKRNKYHYEVVIYHDNVRVPNVEYENGTTGGEYERNYEWESGKRSVRTIIDIALNNKWTDFITITLDKEKIDRYNEELIIKKLRKAINNYKYRYDETFRYIIVAEYHKDKAVHFHGLIYLKNRKGLNYNEHQTKKERGKKGNQNISVYEFNYFNKRFGYTWVQPLYNQAEFVSYYLSKYMSKYDDRIYYSRYMRSRGLKQSEELCSLEEDFIAPFDYDERYDNTYTKSFKLNREQIMTLLDNNAHLLTDSEIKALEERIKED